jgi:hypothetical protein
MCSFSVVLLYFALLLCGKTGITCSDPSGGGGAKTITIAAPAEHSFFIFHIAFYAGIAAFEK